MVNKLRTKVTSYDLTNEYGEEPVLCLETINDNAEESELIFGEVDNPNRSIHFRPEVIDRYSYNDERLERSINGKILKGWNLLVDSILLFFIMNVCSIPASAYDFMYQGIAYDVLSSADKTVAVTKLGGSSKYTLTNISIPQTVVYNETDYTVTYISSGAFYDCDKTVSITLPETIDSIGVIAFASMDNLKSINIPYNTKKIDGSAFSYNKSLSDIKIDGELLEEIGDDAFNNCVSLESIELPNSVKRIGESCFSGCKSLQRVSLSSSLTEISKWMFKNCENLQTIKIPSDVTKICNYAFEGCKGLWSVEFNDKLEIIEENVFGGCISLGNIFIPNSVTQLGKRVVAGCPSVEILTIGNGVERSVETIVANRKYYKKVIYGSGIKYIKDSFWTAPGYFSCPIYLLTDNIVEFVNTTTENYTPTHKIYVADSLKYSPSIVKKIHLNNIAKADTISKEYDGLPPTLNIHCLLDGYNAEAVDMKTKVGTYHYVKVRIYNEGGLDNVIEIPCLYTITRGPQTIKWTQEFKQLNAGTKIELTAESNSGLPITYESTDPTAAFVAKEGGKSYLYVSKPGYIMLTAKQEGDNTYKAADGVNKVIQIVEKNAEYATGDTNGDGQKDVFDLVNLSSYILDPANNSINKAAADINKDGIVDIFDYVALASMVLEQ